MGKGSGGQVPEAYCIDESQIRQVVRILQTDVPALIDEVAGDELLVLYNYLDIKKYRGTNLKMVNENSNPVIFYFKLVLSQ